MAYLTYCFAMFEEQSWLTNNWQKMRKFTKSSYIFFEISGLMNEYKCGVIWRNDEMW